MPKFDKVWSILWFMCSGECGIVHHKFLEFIEMILILVVWFFLKLSEPGLKLFIWFLLILGKFGLKMGKLGIQTSELGIQISQGWYPNACYLCEKCWSFLCRFFGFNHISINRKISLCNQVIPGKINM